MSRECPNPRQEGGGGGGGGGGNYGGGGGRQRDEASSNFGGGGGGGGGGSYGGGGGGGGGGRGCYKRCSWRRGGGRSCAAEHASSNCEEIKCTGEKKTGKFPLLIKKQNRKKSPTKAS